MKWLRNIGLKIALYCIMSIIVNDTMASEMNQKAGELGSDVKSYAGKPGKIKQNIVNPAMGATQMKTVDGSISFDGTLQCGNSVNFLKLSVVPDAVSGDITSLKIQINKDLQGGYDTTVDITGQIGGVISGACANGFVSCSTGTWNQCKYYKWKAQPDLWVTVEQYPSTDIAGLGGCYCFNKACSPQNYLLLNINQIISHLGGGVVGAIHDVKPDISLNDGSLADNSIIYSASIPAGCTDQTGSAPTQYYDPKNASLLNTTTANLQVNPPSDGVYSDLKTVFDQQGYSTKICRETRTINCSCPQGYTYDSNTGKCFATPVCPEGTYPEGDKCVCKKSGGEGYTCNCPYIFDDGLDQCGAETCYSCDEEECGYFPSSCVADKPSCPCNGIGCVYLYHCAQQNRHDNPRWTPPPRCSIYLPAGKNVEILYTNTSNQWGTGAEWSIHMYEIEVTGPNSFSRSWKSVKDVGSGYGVRPETFCSYAKEWNTTGLTLNDSFTTTAEGWYNITHYYLITFYWVNPTWNLKISTDFNCPPGGSYDPGYQKCVATPSTQTAVNSNCGSAEQDQNCKLYYERVDLGDNVIPSNDDVFTVKDFISTGIILQDQCRYDCPHAQQICHPWWLKEKSFICETVSYDFPKERIKTVITSANSNPNPETQTTYTYTDKRQTENGGIVTEQGTIERADYGVTTENCTKACKVKKPVANTQVTDTGSTTYQNQTDPQTYEFYYRECSNNTCPYNSAQGESVVINCQCINEFGSAAGVLSALNEAGKDMICSSGQKR